MTLQKKHTASCARPLEVPLEPRLHHSTSIVVENFDYTGSVPESAKAVPGLRPPSKNRSSSVAYQEIPVWNEIFYCPGNYWRSPGLLRERQRILLASPWA